MEVTYWGRQNQINYLGYDFTDDEKPKGAYE